VTSHPNILKLIDFHEDETHVYIITERYTGGELFNVIAENTTRSGCLNEAYAASIIKSVLEAVEYLHSLGIVHRDLKPENILFESERDDDDDESGYCDHFATNSIRLIDFGLSIEHNIKVDGEYLTDTVGTSYYMSPEVIMGKYTKSCDIWSVGIITYILLCGYPPFNGENEQDVKETILLHGHAENVNFKLRGWDGKSDEVKDFIKCLLRRDPRKRFTAQQALMHPWLKIYC
jgi:serine/threonine protein kinase